ncbi:MAG: phenylalanine--tRNA ligase subunit alpha, partial [Myxococcota bacterium]|nr:phenylalanine--tRNA ligase subunit alpha [Myxococcota bacterium]
MLDHDETLARAHEELDGCLDVEALRTIERQYLGKQGVVQAQLAEIPSLEPDARRAAGQAANLLKKALQQAV